MKIIIKITAILTLAFLFSSIAFSQSKTQFQNKFVIVLDVQQEFTENAMSESSSQKLIDSINHVIENTAIENVIYVKDTTIHRALSISFTGITVDTLISKYDFDGRLKIVNGNIFTKGEGNAFTSKELTNFLNKNNAKEIIVVGLMAEGCVIATLMGGKELTYEMFVIPDAIVGKSKKGKKRAIKKLKKNGINLLHL